MKAAPAVLTVALTSWQSMHLHQSAHIPSQNQFLLFFWYFEQLDPAQVIGRHAVRIITTVEQARGTKRLYNRFIDVAKASIKMYICVLLELCLYSFLATIEHAHVWNNQLT